MKLSAIQEILDSQGDMVTIQKKFVQKLLHIVRHDKASRDRNDARIIEEFEAGRDPCVITDNDHLEFSMWSKIHTALLKEIEA